MCGIFFSICSRSFLEASPETIQALQARGPDSLHSHHVTVKLADRGQSSTQTSENPSLYLSFVSTVLALRGTSVHVQPLVDEQTGSVLCWNGEAWQIQGKTVNGNDTRLVFQLLLKASTSSLQDSADEIVKVLTSIAGPFAFVFYDALSQKVYFGRDSLGRRSLMISKNHTGGLVLSSISSSTLPYPSVEVDTHSFHAIDLTISTPLPQPLVWNCDTPAINRDVTSYSTDKSMPTASAVRGLLLQLQDSLRLRVTDIPTLSHRDRDFGLAKVAILFSGGLDCTILARLTHDLIPDGEEIDLLNVAFENPRSIASNPATAISPYELCPDRITGRASHAELLQTSPQRVWRFVAIDIPFAESTAHRSNIIQLMAPHNAEMDLSIAMALYFATRGQGYAIDPTDPDPNPKPYRSPARVLLSGLGADELFAGYTRHAAAFNRSGFVGLIDELDLDFLRIGHRNLGRDDRVISHWGREVRYPYLDETFIKWALELPVWEKCGFRPMQEIAGHNEGTAGETGAANSNADLDPAKMLLRLLAWTLGMKSVARERKRAIQFGARTAKMQPKQGKVRGTDTIR